MSESSETQQDEPERVVMMDGETATELLMDGETEATLFDGEDGELVRKPTKIINTAGPHPLYSGSSSSEEVTDSRPLWKQLLPQAVIVGSVFAITVGVMYTLPAFTITVNGETATVPTTGGALWGAVAIMAFAAFVVFALKYAPGKAGGVHR